MSGSKAFKSYVQSFLWLSLAAALAAVIQNTTHLVIVDFIHGNPHRPKSNAIEMIWLFGLLLGLIAIIGVLLVFSVPQAVQAMLARYTEGSRFQLPTLIASLPLTSVLTWYCWEYLTPTNFNLGINTGSDWVPFQHGISLSRYLGSLAWQTPVTVFSFLYYQTPFVAMSKRRLVWALFLVSAVVGVVIGYTSAKAQFQFLQ